MHVDEPLPGRFQHAGEHGHEEAAEGFTLGEPGARGRLSLSRNSWVASQRPGSSSRPCQRKPALDEASVMRGRNVIAFLPIGAMRSVGRAPTCSSPVTPVTKGFHSA